MTFQGQTRTKKKTGTWFWVLFNPDLSYSWPVCDLHLNARHLYCSVAKPCPTLCDRVDCSTPGFPVLHYLPKLAQTHIHWVTDAIQPSFPLSSPSPPVFPSIRIFSDESVLHIRWPKYWSFSFSIRPSNEYSGLISRIDWFDLLLVLETLQSLLQHHNSKASILQCSAFFMVQLSHLYMTTGKISFDFMDGPLSSKWCVCFLIHCLGWS